jgi:ribonuclease PH
MTWQRPDGRQSYQLRSVNFQPDFTCFAPGSVLAQCGGTRVLCTVSIAKGVPKFLEGTGKGWLTAEYRMLPSATQQRKERESLKLSGRTQELILKFWGKIHSLLMPMSSKLMLEPEQLQLLVVSWLWLVLFLN